MKEINFDGQVAVITGSGGGLGKAYALEFARRGAKIVVNDLGGSGDGDGASNAPANQVAELIKAAGGDAIANHDSVEHGERIIESAMDTFGRVDIVINNAGILRDCSFSKMTDDSWEQIHRVHVDGAYRVTKAAWPHLTAQGYGRIIFTTSAAGVYGNFGQANYSSAKSALLGFGRTLALEGARKNVFSNIIAPVAGSRLTETVFSPEFVKATSPDYVVPFVVNLCSTQSKENGGTFEVGAGWCAKLSTLRSQGHNFGLDQSLSAEMVAEHWDSICDFTDAEQITSLEGTLRSLSKLTGVNLLPG